MGKCWAGEQLTVEPRPSPPLIPSGDVTLSRHRCHPCSVRGPPTYATPSSLLIAPFPEQVTHDAPALLTPQVVGGSVFWVRAFEFCRRSAKPLSPPSRSVLLGRRG
jgi:hypothetical protein